MAQSAFVVWQIDGVAPGSNNNGGGYDSSVTSPGTDYSQGSSPHVAFNGSSITATCPSSGSTTLTLSGYTVATTDNGNVLQILSGTNYVAGFYTILSVNTGSNTWTLDRTPSNGSASSALVGNMGGSFASFFNFTYPQNYSSGAIMQVAEGQVCYVKATTYTFTAAVLYWAFLPSFIGFTTTRGDGGQPTITTSTNSVNLFEFNFNNENIVWFQNFIFSCTASTRGNGFAWTGSNYVGEISFQNCIFTGFKYAIEAQTNAEVDCLIFRDCILENCNGANGAITWNNTQIGQQVYFYGTTVKNNTNYGATFLCGNRMGVVNVIRSVFYNNGNHGIFMNSDRLSYLDNTLHVSNSIFHSNAGDGIHIGSGGAAYGKSFNSYNCVYYGNSGYGIYLETVSNAIGHIVEGAGNAFSTTGSGKYHGISALASEVILTGQPFTSPSTGDWTTNSTAGAGLALRGAGWPTAIPG